MKKIAIIGNRGHLGIALDGIMKTRDCEIVGIHGEGAAESAATLGKAGIAARVFDGGWRGMLDRAKPEILVACPPFEEHAEVAAEALGRGVHCFCEKPVATTLEGLAKVAETSARNGSAKLAQMCGPHYDAGMWPAAKLARELGEARCLSAQKSYKLGRREDFFTRRETSSGLFPWVGIHAVSWLYFFSGKRRFKSVSAFHSAEFNGGHGDLEVSGGALFRFEGGAGAAMTADYLRPENPAAGHGDDRLRAAGTGGVLDVQGGRCRFTSSDRDEFFDEPPPRGLFEDFLRAVDGLDSNILLNRDVLRVTQAALLARESADLGGAALDIPEIFYD
jgi:Predicted dehydrogenases and related proteins